MDDDEPLDDNGPWPGTPAVSEYLAIKPRGLYRLIDAGRPPAYKISRLIRLRRVDVERFARSLGRGDAA